jgi:phosphosulfolactate phosphohydrolase-like enzyme
VAGAVIEAILEEPGDAPWRLEDSAHVALAAWRGTAGATLRSGASLRSTSRLADLFHQTWGGAFIARLGLEDDLAVCAQVDTMDVAAVVRGDPPVITAG